MKPLDTSLYFITDSGCGDDDKIAATVAAACEGGATIVQLREKTRTTREYIEAARKVHAVTARFGVPLVIDDRVDVALAVGAEGVHVGQSDMPVGIARALIGPGKIVGATTKTVEQALEAVAAGADYLGVGAIYPTTTKVITVLTPVATLRDIVAAVSPRVKVNAIGGLTKDNIDVLKGSGIDGICVVSAIAKAENPRLAAEELKRAFNSLR